MKLDAFGLCCLAAVLIVLIVAGPTMPAQAQTTSVYVWDFAMRNGDQDPLTENLTTLFEEALVGLHRTYTVVEGRDPARLLEQRQNVRSIQEMLKASEDLVKTIESYRVDQVVFGEVFDDIEGGEIVLTVTFERLDGTKHLVKSSSLRRSLRFDRASQRQMIDELLSGLHRRTRQIDRIEKENFIFDLETCTLSNRMITCHLSVVNDGEDRTLCFSQHLHGCGMLGPSMVFDDTNNSSPAIKIRLANQTAQNGQDAETLLIGARPAELVVTFDKGSSSAVEVARLDLNAWHSDQDPGKYGGFQVTFRNIPITD